MCQCNDAHKNMRNTRRSGATGAKPIVTPRGSSVRNPQRTSQSLRRQALTAQQNQSLTPISTSPTGGQSARKRAVKKRQQAIAKALGQ